MILICNHFYINYDIKRLACKNCTSSHSPRLHPQIAYHFHSHCGTGSCNQCKPQTALYLRSPHNGGIPFPPRYNLVSAACLDDLLFTIKTMFGSNSRRAAPSDWLVPKSRRPNSALSNWWRAVIALDRAPRAAAWGAFFSPPGLSFTITTIERPSQLKFGKAHS